jgi:two-component system, NarL family, sensor kinase
MTTEARTGVAPRRKLLIFIGGALLTLLLISLGTVLIVNQVARSFALRSAQDTTARLATVVGSLLGEALDGDAARRDELDRLVAGRLGDNSILSVQVWRADGEVVYASDRDRIGQRLAPPSEITEVIRQGTMISTIDTDSAEQRTVNVYAPLAVDGQPPLIFEARHNYQRVENARSLVLWQVLPLIVGALFLLQLVEIPIAVRLARRVAGQEAERAALLERALSASERERRQIAADLHDGVIQDLAGAGYALAALTRSVPPAQAATTDRVGVVVRGAVDSLRRLMVDVYPPDLSGGALPDAVKELVAPLRQQGVTVSAEFTALPPMDQDTATTLYRVAREALTNVAKHARASTVRISLSAENGAGVLLRVADDGVGLPAGTLDHRTQGHLGLRLLIDRIADLGGELTVHRLDGRGTIVEARVPARTDGD